jgi:hypothetical protein
MESSLSLRLLAIDDQRNICAILVASPGASGILASGSRFAGQGNCGPKIAWLSRQRQ